MLANNTCQTITIVSMPNNPLKAGVDLSWRESMMASQIKVNDTKVMEALANSHNKYQLYLNDEDRTLTNAYFSTTIMKYSDFITIDITLRVSLPKEEYKITLVGFMLDFTDENRQVYAQVMNSTISYKNKTWQTEMNASMANAQMSTASSTVVGLTSPDSAVGTMVVGSLMAVDPTGVTFRCTKILQVVNKLYFINVNYGTKLDAFLAEQSGLLTTDKQIWTPSHYRYQLATRGKLTKKFVSLSGITIPPMMVKVIVYILSWVASGVKRFMTEKCVLGKTGIYFCFFAGKVHLILFNMVFIDFIWLGPLTLTHSRGLSYIVFNCTLVVLWFIAADLYLILTFLLDDVTWKKALAHYISLNGFCEVPPKGQKEVVKEKIDNSTLNPFNQQIQEGPNQLLEKQIDYRMTYAGMAFNVHLMDMVTSPLSLTKEVYGSLIVRLLAMKLWIRVPLLQLVILSTQYAPGLGITVMLTFEMCRILAAIYAYLKYKYLKNIICLLMDVVQGLFVCAFMASALLISYKRPDEVIDMNFQVNMVRMILMAVLIEILMLVVFIGQTVHKLVKTKLRMKKLNVQWKKYSIIKFIEDTTTQPRSEGPFTRKGFKFPKSKVRREVVPFAEAVLKAPMELDEKNVANEVKISRKNDGDPFKKRKLPKKLGDSKERSQDGEIEIDRVGDNLVSKRPANPLQARRPQFRKKRKHIVSDQPGQYLL